MPLKFSVAINYVSEIQIFKQISTLMIIK